MIPNVVVFCHPAEVLFHEVILDALEDMEHTPIPTVDIQVRENLRLRMLPHRDLSVTMPLVAQVGGTLPGAGIDPRITIPSPQLNAIEGRDIVAREERKL